MSLMETEPTTVARPASRRKPDHHEARKREIAQSIIWKSENQESNPPVFS
jgi:hypothetical protein